MWWIRFPVNAVECMWNWVRRRAEFGMQPLNVTRETGLPPKLIIGEDPRVADFDGVPPWRPLNQ